MRHDRPRLDGGRELCTRPVQCISDEAVEGVPLLQPLLVYHPQSGLCNSLFGLSSAALLATVLCRRFGIAWGQRSNPQAGVRNSC